MIIAQISDLHVQPAGQRAYGIVETNRHLQAAVQHINRLFPQPDMVVATGDLVDEGSIAEYEQLKALLSPLKAPLYLVVGNHDDRSALRQVFSHLPYLPAEGFVQYVVEDWPLRLIMLDTLVEGEGYGNIDTARLAWLTDCLAAAPDRPTLIFMHHPPFESGLYGMDRLRCRSDEALADLIRQYPNVQRVACGHLHRSIQTLWAGTLCTVAPSTAHQVALQLAADRIPALVMEPPGLHLHLWHEGTGLITHTAFVGDFDAYSHQTREKINLYDSVEVDTEASQRN